MSNLINQNPIILDTAGSSNIISSYLEITKIRWVDYNNDIAENDQVVLTNDAGKTVWESRATGIGTVADLFYPHESDFNPPFVVKGLACTTLTHGKVYIYCTSNTRIPASA